LQKENDDMTDKVLNADQAAARAILAGQPVIRTLPKPPQGPSAAEQIAAQPPFVITLNKRVK
jgi:hypothetical protein